MTISLVTYNGTRWLAACLASLRAQTLADYELLVVDNASTDGTLELLREHRRTEPRMKILQSPTNLGFAVANNRSIAEACGDFVMLLNQDVELDEAFLGAAVAAFENRPTVAGVQGRLRLLGPAGKRTDLIDSTGLEMHRDRQVVARRQGEREDGRDLVSGLVWGVDGPAAVFRRSALVAARERRTGGGWEVLDEDFYMYKEDVDLAWRLRNLGWQAWYEPKALAWHARGAGGRPNRTITQLIRSDRTIPRWIKLLSWRNHRLMQLKNETVLGYLRDLPWILRREVLSLGFMLVVDWRRLAVVADFLQLARAAWKKRRRGAARQ
ncbi:MAG: glycosyltransferase family 2 protein [Candidatus Limnocylindrales bacterium]